MNTAARWEISNQFVASPPPKELFRAHFQCALETCVRRGFSVEESFGMIWVETWEQINISEEEQAELYRELLNWARRKWPELGSAGCEMSTLSRSSF